MLQLKQVRDDIDREFERTIRWYNRQQKAARSPVRQDQLQKAKSDAEVLLSEIHQFFDVCDTASSKRVERYRDWQDHQLETRKTLDQVSSLRANAPLSDQNNEAWERNITLLVSSIDANERTIAYLTESAEQRDQRAEATARRIADVAIVLIRIENDASTTAKAVESARAIGGVFAEGILSVVNAAIDLYKIWQGAPSLDQVSHDAVNLWFDQRREAIKILLMYVRLNETLYR